MAVWIPVITLLLGSLLTLGTTAALDRSRWRREDRVALGREWAVREEAARAFRREAVLRLQDAAAGLNSAGGKLAGSTDPSSSSQAELRSAQDGWREALTPFVVWSVRVDADLSQLADDFLSRCMRWASAPTHEATSTGGEAWEAFQALNRRAGDRLRSLSDDPPPSTGASGLGQTR